MIVKGPDTFEDFQNLTDLKNKEQGRRHQTLLPTLPKSPSCAQMTSPECETTHLKTAAKWRDGGRCLIQRRRDSRRCFSVKGLACFSMSPLTALVYVDFELINACLNSWQVWMDVILWRCKSWANRAKRTKKNLREKILKRPHQECGYGTNQDNVCWKKGSARGKILATHFLSRHNQFAWMSFKLRAQCNSWNVIIDKPPA